MTKPWRTAPAAATIYASMWIGYHRGWWNDLDQPLLDAAHNIGAKHPGWVHFWSDVSSIVPTPLHVAGWLSVIIAASFGYFRSALLLAVCGPINEWLVTALKDAANRPRPATMLTQAWSTSFPSGHALETTAFLMALLAFAWPMLNTLWQRIAATAAGLCILLVGAARIALNVHHPTDIIAGWAAGYLLFAAAYWVFRPWKQRHATP